MKPRAESSVEKEERSKETFFFLPKEKKRDRSTLSLSLSPAHAKTAMVLWIVGLGLADERDITLR